VVAILAVGVFVWPRPPIPSYCRVERNALIVTDDRGRELWRKSFSTLNLAAYLTDERMWIGDLDGNGRKSVLFLVAYLDRAPVPESLIAYNSDGTERWHFTPGRTVHTSTDSFEPPFPPRRFLVAPLGREGKLRVAVAGTHHLYYPSQVALLDTNGHVLREYWHAGHLNYLLATDLGEGWNKLIAAGISNARHMTTLLVLDPDHFAGASHEEDPGYQLQDLPPPTETARLLFPRSCINEKLERFTTITRLWKDGTTITVEVQHQLNPIGATIFYHLNPDLTLHDTGIGTSFERAHLALQASGVLKHDLTTEEREAFEHITYLTGAPRVALR
jgi:hypothetical protein